MAQYRFVNVKIDNLTDHVNYVGEERKGSAVGGEDNDHHEGAVREFLAACHPVQAGATWLGPPLTTGNDENAAPLYNIVGKNPTGRTVDLGRYKCTYNGGALWNQNERTTCIFQFFAKP